MSNTTKYNQKHMTQDNRVIIEKGLDSSKPLSTIASELEKDPTTIAKEIKKHRLFQEHNKFNVNPYRCALKNDCKKKHVCSTVLFCNKPCRNCNKCHNFCDDYIPFDYHCPKTDKAPYVCNACPKKTHCRLDKYFYKAVTAHRQYKTILVESRTGINISEDNLSLLDETVTPLIKNGQSVYTILNNHPEIELCEKTIYNYIDSGALSVKNIDLPKKVKYKLRKAHDSEIDDKGIFEGRTYKDYQEFIKENPDTKITEMDTVVGPEGSRKVLLTFHFCSSDFMMAYLLGSKEAANVEAIFNGINKEIGTHLFCTTMPLILTDYTEENTMPKFLLVA